MLQRTLPALLAAALWTTVLTPASAQAKSHKTGKTGAKETPRAAPAKTGVESDVVGSVYKKTFSFGEVLARAQKDNPKGFAEAVGQAIGTRAAGSFFKPNPAREVTLTRAEVLSALRKSPPAILSETLNQMLLPEAIKQQAARLNAVPTEAQMDAFISFLIKQAIEQQRNSATGEVKPDMTEDQFLEMNHLKRAQLKNDNLRLRVKLNLITQKELEKRLKHPVTPDDFLKASHILVSVKPAAPNAKPEEVKKADADARAKITQIAEDIKASKITFAQAAKNSSDDGSKKDGGDLGIFMRGMMVSEFENAAFGLKPGEISKPVRSQFGYHLIMVEKVGKDLTPEERQTFLFKFGEAQSRVTLQELMANHAIVVNKLAQETPIPFPMGQGGGR